MNRRIGAWIRTVCVGVVLAAALIGASGAEGASPDVHAGGAGGVVKPKGWLSFRIPFQFPEPQLDYLGGPVLRTNETYVVFWDPNGSLPQDYKDLVVRYLQDTAADSGTTRNVYSVANQYYDTTGSITYQSTYAGSSIDTSVVPDGCTPGTGYTSCVTNDQVAAELDSYLFDHGIARPPNRAFFVVFPPGADVCYAPGSCAGTSFCGYHSDFSGGHGSAYFAVIPYAGVPTCDLRQHPNGTVADTAVDVISHEHREMISDPLFSANFAWIDLLYGESSDKCQYYFGPVRDNGTGYYNQVINGHQYLLQTEWSNALGADQGYGCVQDGSDHAPVAAFTTSGTGSAISFDAHGSSDPDGDPIVSYLWDFGDATIEQTSGPTAHHQYATSGTFTVTLSAFDTRGAERTVSHSANVKVNAAKHPRLFTAKVGATLYSDYLAGVGNANTMGGVQEIGAGTFIDGSNFPTSIDVYTSGGSFVSIKGTSDDKNTRDQLVFDSVMTLTDQDDPPAGNRYAVTGTFVVQGGLGSYQFATGSGTISGTCTSSFDSPTASCQLTYSGIVSQ